MNTRDKMTLLMREALDWLASSGSMERARENNFVWGKISGRTATALEKLGLAERRYSGHNDERLIYITARGEALSKPIDEDEE